MRGCAQVDVTFFFAYSGFISLFLLITSLFAWHYPLQSSDFLFPAVTLFFLTPNFPFLSSLFSLLSVSLLTCLQPRRILLVISNPLTWQGFTKSQDTDITGNKPCSVRSFLRQCSLLGSCSPFRN